MDEGDVIHALREVRKKFGNPFAAPPVLAELPLGPHDSPLVAVTAAPERFDFHGLPVERIHLRLVVERLDMARAAVHEEENDALRLRREMGLSWREGIDEMRLSVGGDRLAGEKTVPREHRGQRQRPETAAGFPQKFAPRATAELARFRGTKLSHELSLTFSVSP